MFFFHVFQPPLANPGNTKGARKKKEIPYFQQQAATPPYLNDQKVLCLTLTRYVRQAEIDLYKSKYAKLHEMVIQTYLGPNIEKSFCFFLEHKNLRSFIQWHQHFFGQGVKIMLKLDAKTLRG